jgi:hypothetical protein
MQHLSYIKAGLPALPLAFGMAFGFGRNDNGRLGCRAA